MEQAAVFMNNRSQAIRLPKSAAFPPDVKRVTVMVVGNTRIITPVEKSWDSWFDGECVTADFMSAREQPSDQDREAF